LGRGGGAAGTRTPCDHHLAPRRWDTPAGNILALYFAECERLQVSATSGVVAEIQRRKCGMQSLPFHFVSGLAPGEQIARAIAHHDYECSQTLRAAELQRILQLVAPLKPAAELAPEACGEPNVPLAACEVALVRCMPNSHSSSSDS